MMNYPQWFEDWQVKFYNSKRWRELRNQVRTEKKMRSDLTGKLIKGKSIVDHIIPITPDNYQDESITLNKDNLQLLTLEEHNKKTFGDAHSGFDLENRQDVNLF